MVTTEKIFRITVKYGLFVVFLQLKLVSDCDECCSKDPIEIQHFFVGLCLRTFPGFLHG
jgi:hypothetical protein